MKALLAIVLAVALASESLAETIVTNAADLTRLVYREQKLGVAFDLRCTVLVSKYDSTGSKIYAIDDSGGVILVSYGAASNTLLKAGYNIRARGRTGIFGFRHVVAQCKSIEITGYASPPEPEPVSIDDFRSGRFDCRYVKIRGTLRDAFDDEVDGHFTYLVLNCDGRLLYAPLHTPTQEFKVGDGMIGAEVEIDGICDPMPLGGRRYMGYTLLVQNADAIKILKASDEDAFDVPAIDETQNIGPMEIQALGKRRARGTILAIWRPNNIMLETARRKLIFATIANQTLPAAGTSVEVVGLPETDLFSLTLSRAAWRPSKDAPDSA